MSQVSTVLERTDRIARGASVLQTRAPMIERIDSEDDDVLDAWLASLSVDDFERFLSRLADLR